MASLQRLIWRHLPVLSVSMSAKYKDVHFVVKDSRSQILYKLWIRNVRYFVPVPTINLAAGVCIRTVKRISARVYLGIYYFPLRAVIVVYIRNLRFGIYQLLKGSMLRTRGVTVRQFLMTLIDLQRPSWSLRRSRRVLPRQVSVRTKWIVLSLYFS